MTYILVIDDKQVLKKAEISSLSSCYDLAGILSSHDITDEIIANTNAQCILVASADQLDVLQKTKPPVILIWESASTRDVFKHLKGSIVDFIPVDNINDISLHMSDILAKIQSVAKINPALVTLPSRKGKPIIRSSFSFSRKKCVVIASSTGGPQTLERFLSELPKNTPVPILIVQHMPEGFTKSFAERLNTKCELPVREAKNGDELEKGVILIAPAGYHMELKSDFDGFEGTILLNKLPKENGVRPAADRLFASVAKIFKENTIGIVLTGMGHDGLRGCEEIKKEHGTVLAQSERTSIIYSMPKAVIEKDLADEVFDIDDMAVGLVQLLEI